MKRGGGIDLENTDAIHFMIKLVAGTIIGYDVYSIFHYPAAVLPYLI